MRKIILIITVLFTSACTTVGRYDTNASLDSNDESYFLLGINSDEIQVTILNGEIENEKFTKDILYVTPTLSAVAKNGYIMGKAPEGATLAVTDFISHAENSGLIGNIYKLCDNKLTMSFTVPGGKVIYLGDIEVKEQNHYLNFKYIQDYNSAKKYIKQYHPELINKLSPWKFKMLPITNEC